MLAEIPFLYFLFLLIRHLRKSTYRFGIGAVALSWVTISSFFGIFVDTRNLYGTIGVNDYALSVEGVLLYCILWTFVLIPLTKLDNNELTITEYKDNKLFQYTAWGMIVCVIIYLLGSNLVHFMTQQLQISRDAAYEDAMYSVSEQYKGKGQFWLWIPLIITNSWPLLLLFWFISLGSCRQSTALRVSLLLSSVIVMLAGFANGGRAQLVWWLVTFSGFLGLFAPTIDHKTKVKIIFALGVIGSLSIIGILAITMARFDNGFSSDIIDSIISYAGQQCANFCAQLPFSTGIHFYTDRIFPLYTLLTERHPYDLISYYSFLDLQYPYIVNNVFFTVFGNILMDLGWIGLLCFLILFKLICKYFIFNNDNTLTISNLIILSVIFCIPVRGIFGYPFSGHMNTLFILLSFALYFVFLQKKTN